MVNLCAIYRRGVTLGRMSLCEPKTRRDQRREAILDVARAVFSEEGYAAASMSTIAARLGGSKGTLYNYFKNKAQLFEAFVRDYCEQHAEYVFGVSLEGRNVEEVLTGVGERFLHLVLSDEATCFYRLIVAEAQHNPAVGRALYDSGYRIAIERLAEYLEDARTAGLIATQDCKRAADDFLMLCQGLQWKRVLNVACDFSDADIRAEAARLAGIFVRAYGT
ncbi:MAG TPA: TetR/AcrR family transcriptional regulator [Alphaproteobacteria bacterium]|nr:TetR/AcrR family transcriptional regulator [Alphaproteobacteria bacterium]